jgi:hypothetical protein
MNNAYFLNKFCDEIEKIKFNKYEAQCFFDKDDNEMIKTINEIDDCILEIKGYFKSNIKEDEYIPYKEKREIIQNRCVELRKKLYKTINTYFNFRKL